MAFLCLLLIIIFTVLIKLPYLQVPLDADFGIYGYHGLFWLRGQKMPVKDTIENHPPGRWLLYALLLKYFKVSRQLFRYSAIGFIVLTQLSVFIMATTMVSLNYACIAAIIYGILISFPTFVWVQSSDEIGQSAFTALAISLVTVSPNYGTWIFILIGVLTFMSLFFKQSAYINAFPPVLLAIIVLNFSWLNLLFFILGAIPGILLTGFYFYQKNMFDKFLNIFALSVKAFKMHLDNIFYGRKKIVRQKETESAVSPEDKQYVKGENEGFQSRQKQFARDIYRKFFSQTLIFTIFLPLVFLNFPNHQKLLITAAAWLIFGAAAIYLNKHVMPYHFIPVAVPVALLSAIGVYAVWNKFYYFAIPIIFFLLLLCLFLIRREVREIIKREKIQRGLMYINHPNEWLFFTLGEKIGKSLKEATTSTDKIYVWGAQYETYLWAERMSPTRSLFCPHPSVSGYVPTPFKDELRVVEKITDEPPKYIVITAETKGFERFRSYLEENYTRVQGRDEEVQIFRWIYADILPTKEKEAKRIQNQYLEIDNYQSRQSDKIQALLIKGNKVSYEDIRHINPFHKIANEKLADIYFHEGKVDKIMNCLHYLWLTDHDNFYVSKKLGEICLINQKYDQSEKLFRKALWQDSIDSRVIKNLSFSLFHQAKFSEARELMEKSRREDQFDSELNEKLMELYWLINRRREAQAVGAELVRRTNPTKALLAKINQFKNQPIETFDKAANQININWEGSQFVYHSLALVNREQSLRLVKAGFNLSVLPYEKDQFEPAGDYQILKQLENRKLIPVDIHVRHQWPPNLSAPKSGHWVVIQPWEFGYLPVSWVETFNNEVDEMWVPSTYVKQVYCDSGVDKDRVFVVPNGVDTQKFNPAVKPYPLKTHKKFKFLFIGGTIYRKGIDLLLKAYINAFSATDDVCLVIKDFGGQSFYKNQNFKEEISRLLAGDNNPEIEYINEILTDEELSGLYTACDVLVHPYRGEGFGLPILEALACGVPTMITKGGAALDFCNSRTSLFIEAKKKILDVDEIQGKKLVDKIWFWEADIDDLVIKMKYAAGHSEILRQMGDYAHQYVQKNWEWNVITLLTQNRIQKLVRKPIIRFQKDIFETINIVTEADETNNLEDVYKSYSKDYEKGHLGNDLFGKVLCAKFLQKEAVLRKYLPVLANILGDNPIVLNLIGVIYFELGENAAAIDYFKKSLQYNEDFLDVRRNLAEALLADEDYEAGIQEFVAVINRSPHDTVALLRLAELSLEAGRHQDALAFIEKVLAYDSQNELALQLKSMINDV